MAMCIMCTRGGAPNGGMCWRCRRQYAPTYLDHVISSAGLTTDEIVAASGLSRRTILAAQSGSAVSRRTAEILAQSLGLDYDLIYDAKDDVDSSPE